MTRPDRAARRVGAPLLAAVLTSCALPTDDGPKGERFATCDDPVYPVQQLRLLTRREYNQTVRDLMPTLASTCTEDHDCELTSQSCVADACVADPCEVVTFILPAPDGPYRSVHVAGSFNGWSESLSGGWAMTWVPSQKRYVTKRVVADGTHQYKLVVDEGARWITDPSNPQTTPDGFGGSNSVLVQDCDGAAPPADDGFDPAADLPKESRPPGYAFDNHADAGLVTNVHVEQYLRAAERLADQALSRRSDLIDCDPTQQPCLEGWLRRFGKRAFRRPLSSEELDRYAALVRDQPDADSGLSVALQVMLSSPYFLYRSEIGASQPDGSFLLDAHETASALSYFLWGTMPDEALLAAADAGELDTPEGIETHARRLLDDPRAHEIVATFAVQWLGIERVTTADKSPNLYPGYTPAMRAAQLEETRRFFEHVVFEGSQRYRDLYTADFTFVNDATAALYDLPAPGSQALVKVPYGDAPRAGFLSHGSLLSATSHSDQTSPIRRGVFVREHLLCQDLPEPPPNAGGVPDVDPDATTRERFAQHTSNPACFSCHQYIDDLGFGFETFDAVGAWRDTENGEPIDARGDMNDVEGLGTETSQVYDSVPELAAILAEADSARRCFSSQWLRFAIGREEDPSDCSMDLIDEAMVLGDGSVQELLIAITQSPSFTRRRSAP